MATLKQRLGGRGRAAAVRLVDLGVGGEIAALRKRVAVLEDEVHECRQLNLRLAELTDVVGELLLPVAQRDETRVAEVMEQYARGI